MTNTLMRSVVYTLKIRRGKTQTNKTKSDRLRRMVHNGIEEVKNFNQN